MARPTGFARQARGCNVASALNIRAVSSFQDAIASLNPNPAACGVQRHPHTNPVSGASGRGFPDGTPGAQRLPGVPVQRPQPTARHGIEQAAVVHRQAKNRDRRRGLRRLRPEQIGYSFHARSNSCGPGKASWIAGVRRPSGPQTNHRLSPPLGEGAEDQFGIGCLATLGAGNAELVAKRVPIVDRVHCFIQEPG